jgi:hypothetical protein
VELLPLVDELLVDDDVLEEVVLLVLVPPLDEEEEVDLDASVGKFTLTPASWAFFRAVLAVMRASDCFF